MSSLDVRSIDGKDLRHEPCPASKHEFRVFLSERAFDRAVARGDGDTTREIGGVLVGEVLRDDAGPYLRIENTIDALHAEEKGAELTFTHATWEHIHKEMDTRHAGKRVVGWYHTHPGFGVFLSDRDQFIHKSFFNLPFQVAFVYDPKSREHGMFTWHENEVWRARRYWIGQREQAWDGPRTAGERPVDKRERKAKPDGKVDAEERPAPSPEPRDDSLRGAIGPLAVIGLLVMLVGGFVGHWLGTRAANEAILDVQANIGRIKAEAAQAAIATLQTDLLGLLRETLGDDALQRPLVVAVNELDRAIAALSSPATPSAAPAGAGSAAPVAGTGSAAPDQTATIDPKLQQVLAQLATTRHSLFQLSDDRARAQSTLARLQIAARHGGELRVDLAREVADQRAGLGALYAELAIDALKAKDPVRARRFLAVAARLDPGNRARYEKQLQTFDKAARLPQDISNDPGAAGQGNQP